MPIVVQHQPSFVGVGQTAFRAGYGQFEQQQFQNSMAVMQMALQERARQQALANQQQANYLGAQQDAADRQSRERMFMLQQNNQAAMNDADNRSRMQMELWQGQQQAQNYADLRDHQTQLAQFKAASSSAEYDKKARLDALGKAASGVDTRGAQLASQLRTELGMITSARAAGTMTDQTFQQAMQAWDEKFAAQGDWSQFRADPAAQAKAKLASQQVEDPQWGTGQLVTDNNGNTFFMPRGPVEDPVKYPGMVGMPDPKKGIDWQPKQQPKVEKPPAAQKAPFTLEDLNQMAEDLAEEFPGFTKRHFIESGIAGEELKKRWIPGVTAPAGAEGEAPPQAGPQQQPGQAPQQQPQQQQGAPQADAGMEANEPPPSVQGEQERQQWQMMAQLPKTKPEYTQDAKDIQQLLSQGLPLTHPQVQSKVAGLASKIADEAKKKGLVAPPQQQQSQQQPSQPKFTMMDVPPELEKLGIDYREASGFLSDMKSPDGKQPLEFYIADQVERGKMTPQQAAELIEKLVSDNPDKYIESRKKRPQP